MTLKEEKANNKVTYTITVKPWPTKKVTSVTWRGYNAGSGDYQHGEATAVSGKTNVYTFEASVAICSEKRKNRKKWISRRSWMI